MSGDSDGQLTVSNVRLLLLVRLSNRAGAATTVLHAAMLLTDTITMGFAKTHLIHSVVTLFPQNLPAFQTPHLRRRLQKPQ